MLHTKFYWVYKIPFLFYIFNYAKRSLATVHRIFSVYVARLEFGILYYHNAKTKWHILK